MCKATKYQLSKLQCSVCGLGILVTEGRLVDVAVGVADLEGGGALQRRYHAQLGDTEDQEDGNIRDTAQGGEKRCKDQIYFSFTHDDMFPSSLRSGWLRSHTKSRVLWARWSQSASCSATPRPSTRFPLLSTSTCPMPPPGLRSASRSVGTHQQFNIIFPCFPNYIYYLSAVSALFIIHNAVAEKCELTTPDWPLPPRPHNSALSLTIVTIVH